MTSLSDESATAPAPHWTRISKDIDDLMNAFRVLRQRRDDVRLLQIRREIGELWVGVPGGEYSRLLDQFDDVVIDRRIDGKTLRSYGKAREILAAAAAAAQEELLAVHGLC